MHACRGIKYANAHLLKQKNILNYIEQRNSSDEETKN